MHGALGLTGGVSLEWEAHLRGLLYRLHFVGAWAVKSFCGISFAYDLMNILCAPQAAYRHRLRVPIV